MSTESVPIPPQGDASLSDDLPHPEAETTSGEAAAAPASKWPAIIVALATALTLAGYQLVSFLPEYLAVDSRVVTVPFRAALAGLYIWLLILGFYVHRGMRLRVPTLALTIFWILYTVRLLLDTVIAKVPLDVPAEDYIAYFAGLALLPLLGMLWAPVKFPARLAFGLVLVMHIGTSILSLTNRLGDASATWTRMSGNDSLNSISLGHTGVALLLMVLIYWVHQPGRFKTWMWAAGAGAVGMLGMYIVFVASSRAAFLALAVLLPFLLWSAWKAGARLKAVIVALCTLAATPFVIERALAAGTDLSLYVGSREALLESESAVGRYTLIADAWQQFLDHPLWGSSLVERNSLFYPHNYVVESFMATGVLGGLAFCLVLFISVRKALRLLRDDRSMSWVALLFLQALIGGMFSGALYSAPIFWSLLGVVLAAKNPSDHAPETDLEEEPEPVAETDGGRLCD